MNPEWSKVESVTEAPVQPLIKEKKTTMFEIKKNTPMAHTMSLKH